MKETFVFSVKKDTRRVEVSNHWKYCVGSGQAKLAMRSDYARQLKFIHDELGIERVRFHGIFDDDMQAIMSMADMMPMPGAEKFQNYNFFNIFAAYDNVLAAGMKPWVELSFMPSTIAKRKKKVTVNAEGMKTMPAKDDDWVKLYRRSSGLRYTGMAGMRLLHGILRFGMNLICSLFLPERWRTISISMRLQPKP